MSEISINDGGYAFARPAFAGISQRRLLAGIILGNIVGALTQRPPQRPADRNDLEIPVKAAIAFADELIKQTEET